MVKWNLQIFFRRRKNRYGQGPVRGAGARDYEKMPPMCGRMNVTDSPFVRELMTKLGLNLSPRAKNNIAPGSTADIVVEDETGRQLREAYWSLLIEPKVKGQGYRPNPKWKTFNARSTRLSSSRLWSSAFRSHRAIIPASCFFEWKDGVCYAVGPETAGIAFGGLYRTWQYGDETVYSFTVITLPGQAGFRHIHAQSYPLMLEEEDYDRWLDPGFTQVEAFDGLLNSGIRRELRATPVDSPATMEVTGESELIVAGAA